MKAAIVGATGGIGAAMVAALKRRPDCQAVSATWAHSAPADSDAGEGVVWTQLDPTEDEAVKHWLESIGQIDWLINCVGYLHDAQGGPEKTITQFDAAHFLRSMQVNTLPTLLLAKHARPVFKGSSRAVFATVSARVGSIGDNRLGGWYSYRASKTALNMALKCLAIEWQRTAKHVRVLALHPGTTDTALSMPFQANVPEGKLFAAAKTADYLIARMDEAHEHDSGRFVAYDGQTIPW